MSVEGRASECGIVLHPLHLCIASHIEHCNAPTVDGNDAFTTQPFRLSCQSSTLTVKQSSTFQVVRHAMAWVISNTRHFTLHQPMTTRPTACLCVALTQPRRSVSDRSIPRSVDATDSSTLAWPNLSLASAPAITICQYCIHSSHRRPPPRLARSWQHNNDSGNNDESNRRHALRRE
jgi:hypothetical protein